MFQTLVLSDRLKATSIRTVVPVVLAMGFLGPAAPAAGQLPAPPVVGRGPFQVGGYAGLTLSHAERPEKTERPEVSEMVAAILAWGQISQRASYLLEVDLAKQTTETWTGREADNWLLPVRAYAEYTASDLLRLRLGRFLTPVGQWNEHHAEPLTWTPTRPLTTYRPFAKSLDGILAAGSGSVGSRDLGYAVFWSPTGTAKEDEESSFLWATGGRLALALRPGLTLGVSGMGMKRSEPEEWEAFEGPEEHEEGREDDQDARALLGADLRWDGFRFQVSAEGVWLPATEHGGSEGGGFLQAAIRLTDRVWGVGRGEGYRLPGNDDVQVGFAGLTLRYSPRFVAKLGWQFTDQPSPRIPDGWFFSISSLF